MGFVYLVCFVLDPYIISLRFGPLKYQAIHRILAICTVFITLDILSKPFMGIEKNINIMKAEARKQKE